MERGSRLVAIKVVEKAGAVTQGRGGGAGGGGGRGRGLTRTGQLVLAT